MRYFTKGEETVHKMNVHFAKLIFTELKWSTFYLNHTIIFNNNPIISKQKPIQLMFHLQYFSHYSPFLFLYKCYCAGNYRKLHTYSTHMYCMYLDFTLQIRSSQHSLKEPKSNNNHFKNSSVNGVLTTSSCIKCFLSWLAWLYKS